MKSYTDLEQSKKLAEILPIESADMRYHTISQYNPYPCDEIIYTIDFGKPYGIDIPCWSLAALMDVIPYNISFNKAVYRFKMVKYSDHWECYHENFGSVSTEIFKANNQIDACIEMIIRLHELKML